MPKYLPSLLPVAMPLRCLLAQQQLLAFWHSEEVQWQQPGRLACLLHYQLLVATCLLVACLLVGGQQPVAKQFAFLHTMRQVPKKQQCSSNLYYGVGLSVHFVFEKEPGMKLLWIGSTELYCIVLYCTVLHIQLLQQSMEAVLSSTVEVMCQPLRVHGAHAA